MTASIRFPLVALAAILLLPGALAFDTTTRPDEPLAFVKAAPVAPGPAPLSLPFVAIFQDNAPWDTASNEAALAALGYPFTMHTSADMGLVDLSVYDKVVIASDQIGSFQEAYLANRAWFEAYLSAGGVLEIHAADNGWYSPSWSDPNLVTGVTYFPSYLNTIIVANPADQVMHVPHTIAAADLQNWGYSTHGYFAVPPGMTSPLTNADGQPVIGYAPFGDGCLLVTAQTLEYGYAYVGRPFLENVLASFPCGEFAPPPPVPELSSVALAGAGLGVVALGLVLRRRF